MKCYQHAATDACAICAYCGKALCRDCIQTPTGSRLVCSSGCAEGLSRTERAIQSILQQTSRSVQASAFYCYLCAALSAGASVIAWFMLPSPFLILFTGGCAVALLVSGILYGRAGRRMGTT